jgi:heptosyltransferase II
MKALIVKHGALGDVVRTSYFAAPLQRKHGADLKLTWITAPEVVPLIARNPYIGRIVTKFEEIASELFDIIYSLDDERDVLDEVGHLQTLRIVGAYLKDGSARYSENSKAWFDMGLLSRFGKEHADKLKKCNMRSHGDIFAEIFEVAGAERCFFGDAALEQHYREFLGDQYPIVGINPFAGGRWPAKELRLSELNALIEALIRDGSWLSNRGGIVLIGAGSDRVQNLRIVRTFSDSRVLVADTDASPLHLAALIRNLDFLVSSDSLAMHLAIAQAVPTVAFFAPTSAVEIDGFGLVSKVVSTAHDYCSYRKDADNSSITHGRLLEALTAQFAGASSGERLPSRRDPKDGRIIHLTEPE